jgi:hypothetical protein
MAFSRESEQADEIRATIDRVSTSIDHVWRALQTMTNREADARTRFAFELFLKTITDEFDLHTLGTEGGTKSMQRKAAAAWTLTDAFLDSDPKRSKSTPAQPDELVGELVDEGGEK